MRLRVCVRGCLLVVLFEKNLDSIFTLLKTQVFLNFDHVCTTACLKRPYFVCFVFGCATLTSVPMGPPSRGGDVAHYMFDINQPSLPTPFK